MDVSPNVDSEEIDRFAALSDRWWDRKGAFGALHDINPVRLRYIRERAPLTGRQVLDVGCGGGLLSEALAAEGARVTGIDLGAAPLAAAEAHRTLTGNPSIAYRLISAEALAREMPAAFDLVTCMELLEHVPDPAAVVMACARLARPGGDVFFATLNRTPQAYLLAIVVAERLMGIVEPGTHRYRRLVRPSELSRWAMRAGLDRLDFSGLQYLPVVRRAWLGGPTGINYLMHFRRPAR